MNDLKELTVLDFSLKHTLDCGQFFLFEKIEDFYYIIDGQRVFRVKQEGDLLFYSGISEDSLIYFFSLDLDYKDLINDFDSDEYLPLALEKYWGLRFLRQDFWQCMIGFICSQNSNIPRIKNNLKKISECFGEEVKFCGQFFHTFPNVGSIDNLDVLKDVVRLGYRAKYIYDLNLIFMNKSELIDEIKEMNYKYAKEKLCTLPGVGPKVADCICLFGLGHNDAFPIDTWMKQIVEKLYLKREAKNLKEISDFIDLQFGVNRGFKQQYLFHYARNNLKK